MSMNSEQQRLLRNYLRDHHAGSVAGAGLAGRVLRNNRGTTFEEDLRGLVDEINADQEDLRRVMSLVGVRPNRVKDALATAAEHVARLKPNGRVSSYSPLSRVVEIEGLVMAVSGKLAGWRALEMSLGGSVGGLPRLVESARSQLATLDRLGQRAAEIAFGSELGDRGDPPPSPGA
jgi:hypothetical protein